VSGELPRIGPDLDRVPASLRTLADQLEAEGKPDLSCVVVVFDPEGSGPPTIHGYGAAMESATKAKYVLEAGLLAMDFLELKVLIDGG
jgi:hypothetical protein